MDTEKRSITLRPSRRAWLWYWVTGILLLPLFGAGLYLILKAWRESRSVELQLFDREIRFRSDARTVVTPLASIEEVTVVQSRMGSWLNTGDLIVAGDRESLRLPGLAGPHQIAGAIRHTAAAERQRAKGQTPARRPEPAWSPGTLPRLDDLTGLWQQGLISEEDFLKERKRFED
ncbi:MAG: hypothetical protein WD529_02385 [Balneolaceae bacterium]